MSPRIKTLADESQRASPVWTAVVLMASLTGVFALVSVFLVNNHEWTDTFLSALPEAAVSLADDPGLAGQMRIMDPSAKVVILADQTRALIGEATVVNDALIPAAHLWLELRAYSGGEEVRRASGSCGKKVSERLLQRLPLPELLVLGKVAPGHAIVLQPGEQVPCQVAIPEIPENVEEISLRIASAEALPGHPQASFRPAE